MHAHRKAFFKFPLDDFQEEACQAIDQGKNVLVCAPTGAGKTVVAEWAMMSALSAGKRCLYTTPLKALSNQKFFDLCQLFGEQHVGLSTGDVSVRGQADLVVMTTEVYRNMLYGTGPGKSGLPSVSRVASVILDECHYMNDTDRGTVWEESIIYSPYDVQIVGLSATVANAEQMRAWLEAIHGPTELVSTSFRPVPLRHYYFRKGELLPVLDKGNPSQINPRMFRFKDDQPPRRRKGISFAKLLCDPRKLVERLQQKEMLPAIYFVFSRKGCETLLEETRGGVQLTQKERKALDAAILARANQNPEILEHPHLDNLRRGMAVHHAGILPLWKSLVESLFAQGLVKVVFATETLAAGINMPARTTIISALSKYTNDGLRPLTGSEMLQMSGRAGRRGMDKVGNVIIGAHPKEPVEMVIRLTRARPEALESHFLPSYGMVLNLLQRRPLAQVKELLDRSFGQFLHRRQQERLGVNNERIGEVFKPPCPDRPGDRQEYLSLSGRRKAARGMLKDYEGPIAEGETSKEVNQARQQLQEELAELNYLRRQSPCHGCPKFHPCGQMYEKLAAQDKPSYWEEFQALAAVLTQAGLLDQERPTENGVLIGQLRASNVYAVGESLLGPVLEHVEEIGPPQFAAICSLLISEPGRRDPRLEPPAVSRRTRPHLHRILRLCEEIEDEQLDHGVERPVPEEMTYCGVAEIWGSNLSWEATLELSGLSAGDLFRILRRTYDLCRQVARWQGAPRELTELAQLTCEALLRGPLEENLSFFEVPEGDAHDLPEGSLLETELPTLRPLDLSGVDDVGKERGVRKRVTRRRPSPLEKSRKPGRPKARRRGKRK